jgi:hypothetical protein
MQIQQHQIEPLPTRSSDELRLVGIPLENLLENWPIAKQMLNPSLYYADGKYTMDDIFNGLRAREMQLWFVESDTEIKCALITQIHKYAHDSRLVILFLAGFEFNDVMELWGDLADFAREKGCSSIEMYGRPGWEKRLKRLGFHKTQVVLKCPL